MSKLAIIESPGKIKKMRAILGNDFKVSSTLGHLMDLDPTKLSVDIENDFEPEYKIMSNPKNNNSNRFANKKKIVNDLKLDVKNASEVYIASDLDTEGEFIAWSCMELLKLKNYKRIVFTSITKKDIDRALKNPGKIDMNMVEAQKTRRIEDRLIGFLVSFELNKLLKMTGLSAGRVQSSILRLVCDKEHDVSNQMNKEKEKYISMKGKFSVKNKELTCDLKNENGDTKIFGVDLDDIMDQIIGCGFEIRNVTMKQTKRNPSSPYVTSSVQCDASSKLGFPAKKTMLILQKLYEKGFITYMRTDSVKLSDDALDMCKKYIVKNHGDKYYRRKNYTTNNSSAQEAHEAIRPTDCTLRSIDGDDISSDDKKLFDMIWKNTMASQMCPMEIDSWKIIIDISDNENYYFESKIETITFEGYGILYGESCDAPEDIPQEGDIVDAQSIMCREMFEEPPMRYNEAGLIKKMKTLGIGRPATTEGLINTLQKRNYVKIDDVIGVNKKIRKLEWNVKDSGKIYGKTEDITIGNEKKKYVPTELGEIVNSVMIEHFPEIVDYKFTAKMEKDMDLIHKGEKNRIDVLRVFWGKIKERLDNIQILIEKNPSQENKIPCPIGGRMIGIHPISGCEIVASVGKFGPMVTTYDNKNKQKLIRASINKPYKLNKLTLDEAIELLKYPKNIGSYEGKNIIMKNGQNGYYITWDSVNVNVENDVAEELDENDAIKLLKDKIEKQKNQDYLFYELDKKKEYIVRKGKENGNIYLMVRTRGSKIKPLFVSISNDIDIEKIKLSDLKKLVTLHKTDGKISMEKVNNKTSEKKKSDRKVPIDMVNNNVNETNKYTKKVISKKFI
jgi:DNA topoisomerase I